MAALNRFLRLLFKVGVASIATVLALLTLTFLVLGEFSAAARGVVLLALLGLGYSVEMWLQKQGQNDKRIDRR